MKTKARKTVIEDELSEWFIPGFENRLWQIPVRQWCRSSQTRYSTSDLDWEYWRKDRLEMEVGARLNWEDLQQNVRSWTKRSAVLETARILATNEYITSEQLDALTESLGVHCHVLDDLAVVDFPKSSRIETWLMSQWRDGDNARVEIEVSDVPRFCQWLLRDSELQGFMLVQLL